ncbi:MAG: transporter, substrate-binding protein aliphatic sulfonates family [Phycisphaerales bacterium]|nr:transporter, substrate-binding protein aliphatic sulfonates family [Phycisphaerales bacterium]
MSEHTPTKRPGTVYLVGFVALVAVAVGLWQFSSKGGAKTSKPVSEVRIGYFANLSHAQGVLGVASGEFEQAISPAKLKTKVFNAGPSLVEALFAGEIDIGYVGPGPALAAHARSKGQGIRVIAGAASNGVLIVARKDSGIRTLADLKGKRIATPQHGNTQDIAARHYLAAELGQKDDNNILPIPNAEQSGMMDRGQIDAAWAPEPWGSRLVAETGATIVAEEKDLWPSKQFALAIVVTTPDFLRDHPDVVAKVLGVHRAWTARLVANPKTHLPQLGTALLALTGKKLPPGVLDSAITRVTFTDDPLPDTFKTMGQWTYDLGFEQQPARLETLFDLSVLKELEKSPKQEAVNVPR